jgi:hypothetical protein
MRRPRRGQAARLTNGVGGGHVELQVGGKDLPDTTDKERADHAVAKDGGLALEGGQVGDAALDDICRHSAQQQRAAELEDGGELRVRRGAAEVSSRRQGIFNPSQRRDCAATHDCGLAEGQGLGADGGAEGVGDIVRACARAAGQNALVLRRRSARGCAVEGPGRARGGISAHQRRGAADGNSAAGACLCQNLHQGEGGEVRILTRILQGTRTMDPPLRRRACARAPLEQRTVEASCEGSHDDEPRPLGAHDLHLAGCWRGCCCGGGRMGTGSCSAVVASACRSLSRLRRRRRLCGSLR